MVNSSSFDSSATFDPECFKKGINNIIDKKIDQITPLATQTLNMTVNGALTLGTLGLATGLVVELNESLPGVGTSMAPTIYSTAIEMKNTSMVMVEPSINSSMKKTAEISKDFIRKSVNNSVDTWTSSW